ncbi:MAG: lysophospholipid acyltransferase family protein [Cyanobacteria bacterium J06641_5]
MPMLALPVATTTLRLLNVRLQVTGRDYLPSAGPVLVVGNHRSILDPLLLLASLQRPIRVVCHQFMARLPGLRQVAIDTLGCIPLTANGDGRQLRRLQERVGVHWQRREWVGIFPEGALPMVARTPKDRLSPFARGFAHLALSAPVARLAVLPVAIASQAEWVVSPFPVRWLQWVAPEEPCFDRPGLHPVILYRQVTVAIGRPYWVERHNFSPLRGKQTLEQVQVISDYCQAEITALLANGTPKP